MTLSVVTRLAATVTGAVSLAVLVLSLSPAAAASHPCDRFAVDGLTLGMRPDTVEKKLGGHGVKTSIRVPDGGFSTGVAYPGGVGGIYVEYDRPIDHRKARVVRVRALLRLSQSVVVDLVRRFGQPNAGGDDLKALLRDRGPAVWIDQTCSLVMTAFRPPSSWWGADGEARLQVETFELAQRSDSPAQSRLVRGANAPIPRPMAATAVLPATVTLQDDLALPEEEVLTAVAPHPSWPDERPLIQAARLAEPAGASAATVSVAVAPPERPIAYVEPPTAEPDQIAALEAAPPEPPVANVEPPTAEPEPTAADQAAPPEPPIAHVEPPTAEPEQTVVVEATPPEPPVAQVEPPTAVPEPTAAPSAAQAQPARSISEWRTTVPIAHVEVPIAEPEPPLAVAPPPFAPAAPPEPPIAQVEPPTAEPEHTTEVSPRPSAAQAQPARSISGWLTTTAVVAPRPSAAQAQPATVPMAKDAPAGPARSIAEWNPSSSSNNVSRASQQPLNGRTRITTSRADQRNRAWDTPAELVNYVEPVSPPTAKWMGVKGHVTLEIVVQSDGRVARAVSLINAIPPGRGFEQASIDAVRQWRYTPATRDGRAVASRLTVTVDIE